MKDLATVTLEEQKRFLDSFDEVFCDADGVIWELARRLPYASAAIEAIKSTGKKVRVVSNNCLKTFDIYSEKFKNYDINLTLDDVALPIMAIIDYLHSIKFDKELFVIAQTGYKEELRKAGFKLAPNAPHQMDECFITLLKESKPNENIGAVIVDFDCNINFINLQKAVNCLKSPEVLYMTGGSDGKLSIKSANIDIIGPKYFHQAITEVSGRKPMVFGKPSILLHNFLQTRFHIKDSSRILFVGDSITEDMGFAATAGYKKLLVLSGITSREDLESFNYPETFRPEYFVESLETLTEIIEKCNSS